MLSRYRRHTSNLPAIAWKLIVLLTVSIIVEGILWYVLPEHFENLFGIEQAGVIVAAYGIGSLLLNLPISDISDKVGRNFTIAIGLLLFLASLVLLQSLSLITAVIFMTVLGIASTCIGAGGLQLILDHTKKSQSAAINGTYLSSRAIGWIVGSILGGMLLLLIDIVWIGVISLIVSTVLFGYFIRIHPQVISWEKIKSSLRLIKKDRIYKGEIYSLKKFGFPLIVYILYCLVYGTYEYAVWIAEPIYTAALGHSALTGALILTVVSLPHLLFSNKIGKLIDRIGGRKIMIAGISLALFSHLYFLLLSAQTQIDLVITFLLIGIADLCIVLNFQKHLHIAVPKRLRAEAYSSGDSFYSIGGIVAPLFIGLILGSNTQFHSLFSSTFVIYLFITTLIAILLLKEKKIFAVQTTLNREQS